MKPQTTPITPQKNKKQLIWGLVCLIGPSVLIVVVLVCYAIANYLASTMSTVGTTGTSPLEELAMIEPSWKAPINIGLFIVGVLGVVAWLPGLICGIVILKTRK
jgi:heme/copper-type cytochrome/quinol oxidase subunit 2